MSVFFGENFLMEFDLLFDDNDDDELFLCYGWPTKGV